MLFNSLPPTLYILSTCHSASLFTLSYAFSRSIKQKTVALFNFLSPLPTTPQLFAYRNRYRYSATTYGVNKLRTPPSLVITKGKSSVPENLISLYHPLISLLYSTATLHLFSIYFNHLLPKQLPISPPINFSSKLFIHLLFALIHTSFKHYLPSLISFHSSFFCYLISSS